MKMWSGSRPMSHRPWTVMTGMGKNSCEKPTGRREKWKAYQFHWHPYPAVFSREHRAWARRYSGS